MKTKLSIVFILLFISGISVTLFSRESAFTNQKTQVFTRRERGFLLPHILQIIKVIHCFSGC